MSHSYLYLGCQIYSLTSILACWLWKAIFLNSLKIIAYLIPVRLMHSGGTTVAAAAAAAGTSIDSKNRKEMTKGSDSPAEVPQNIEVASARVLKTASENRDLTPVDQITSYRTVEIHTTDEKVSYGQSFTFADIQF